MFQASFHFFERLLLAYFLPLFTSLKDISLYDFGFLSNGVSIIFDKAANVRQKTVEEPLSGVHNLVNTMIRQCLKTILKKLNIFHRIFKRAERCEGVRTGDCTPTIFIFERCESATDFDLRRVY